MSWPGKSKGGEHPGTSEWFTLTTSFDPVSIESGGLNPAPGTMLQTGHGRDGRAHGGSSWLESHRRIGRLAHILSPGDA
jgi:hypothetical protein